MRLIRKSLLTTGIALALLLPLAGAASADPSDPGGFMDPTIIAGPLTIHVAAPASVTIIRTAPLTTTAADPTDAGGY